jgi:cell division protein ZapA (FtsZ GTPase activity inhibitor)
MKAFYIIHILALLEIIAAVLAVSKLQDLTQKIKLLQTDLKQKTDINLENMKKLKDLCYCFNDKICQQIQNHIRFLSKKF